MKTYRIGISGAGFGVKAHLPALRAHPRFDLVALASPTSARTAAKEHGVPHAFDSCEAMLQGCDLDAVVIASPPFTHRDDVLLALAAEKHVICEKPFAMSVTQATEMLVASQRAGTACGVAHEFRFVPERAALKHLVNSGQLSPLREIEITYLLRWLRAHETERKRSWWFEREKGGGLSAAIFSHMIDAANFTVGHAPARVFGLLRTANPKRRDDQGAFESTVDDGCFAILDYGGGLIARLAVDATAAVNAFTFAVHAENETAIASGTNHSGATLYRMCDDRTEEIPLTPSPYASHSTAGPNIPYLIELYDQFVRQIETGASALPTFAEAVETQRVLEAIGYSEN